MGKRAKDGMKGPKTGRQRSGVRSGCQACGGKAVPRKADVSGRAKQCGRCRGWIPA